MLMRYAEVAVNAPIGYDRTLSYGILPGMQLEPGQMVWAPLGQRPVQGIVFELTDQPQVEPVKDVIAPVEPAPLVTPIGLELARWISRYYMSPLFDAVALMLPPGFETRVRSHMRATSREVEAPAGLSPTEKEALDLIIGRGESREAELAKGLGRTSEKGMRRLLVKGLIQRRWEIPRPQASHRYECYVRLASTEVGRSDALLGVRASRQAALYRALEESKSPVPLSLTNKEYGPGTAAALLAKGLVALEWLRIEREPALQRERDASTEPPLVPTPEQASALSEITAALEGKEGATTPFLLHGVTGSGKTEVYLRALERCRAMGKKGVFLVPEISLTPQTVHRLGSRFPGKVAVLHSRLSPGERFDQWWRIRDGDYDVVIGPRSALFSPLPDLGLIVLDEEHEWTYKQQDATPRYHARDVALKLGELAGAAVVMGSATPDIETHYKATAGRYRTLKLPSRVGTRSGYGTRAPALAQVEVRDMRRELKEGNRSIFSRALATALYECVGRGEQAILYLNRRGSATVVQCRDCGHAIRCRRCSVTLTYHGSVMRLLCHQCNRGSRIPRGCPSCRSPRIRYLGLGTQRVAEELSSLLPDVSALRWDRDAAQAPHAHEAIMQRFFAGEAQVLIGTQMVAKGLHVPSVTLVGVILADVGLNLPDFRAGERAFQLICQVAGRAGRGESPGRVIIQTYEPGNYAVKAAAAQDYNGFYDREVEFRRQHGNPPFNRLVRMAYLHTNAEACQREAERVGRTLRTSAYSKGLADVEVVGPAPAFPERVRGRYRWHVILKGRNLHSFLEGITVPQGWTIDVDPVSVL